MFWTVFTFELAYWFKRPLTLLFFALFFLMAFFSTASDCVSRRRRDGTDPSQRAVRARDGDGDSHRDRAGDHDGDRRNCRSARRAARHRRDCCSRRGSRRSGYLLGRFAGAFIDHGS